MFLALSLRMNRSVTDFALATLPGTSLLVTTLLARRAHAARRRSALLPGGLAAVLLAAAAWFFFAGYAYNAATVRRPGSGIGPGVPVAAADYVARRHLQGACFNTYSAGAYLAYRFYPDLRVGMDSRNDVYGEDLYADYERALEEPGALAAMLDRIHASFLFIEWAEPGLATTGRTVRALSPPWRPVYFDDRAVVYAAEQGERADLVRRDGYRTLDPMLFRPGQWSPEEARQALAETERARAAAADPLIARVMRIEALRTIGDRPGADREEEALVRLDPSLYHIWILLGLTHLERGEGGAAVERLTQALRLNPRSTAAATALEQARRLGG
jgi:tetratricopeptide (TPR) repeat protein